MTSAILNSIVSTNIDVNSPNPTFSQNSQSFLTSSSSTPSNTSIIDVSYKSSSSEFNYQVSLSLLNQVSDSNSIAPTTQRTSVTLQTPRLKLSPVRFRHSLMSPSLLQTIILPEGETSNKSRQMYQVETLDQSSEDECDSAIAETRF